MGRRCVLRGLDEQTTDSIQQVNVSGGALPSGVKEPEAPAAAGPPVHVGNVETPGGPCGAPAQAGCQAGDGPAARRPAKLSEAATREFEDFLRRWEPPLLLFVRNRIRGGLRSKLGPDDVVQHTFLAAFVNWERFDHGPTALNWLMSTALNHIINVANAQGAAKRGGKQAIAARTAAEDDDAAEELALQQAPGPTPDELASQHEAADSVRRLISGLPPDRRQAVRLHYIEGLCIATVAGELGRSEGSVLMLCNRAMKDMREQLCPGP
jgi:RNA polymerase sigma-70 factor (ECF subfamily)